jgi:hypothetical protein
MGPPLKGDILRLRRALAVLAAIGGLYIGFAPSPASAADVAGSNAFGSAPLVSSAGGVFRGTNRNFTKQPGEPDHGGNDGGASAWYRWRPNTSGVVRITTRGSAFDTLLAVYGGPNLQNLNLVRENDDTPEGSFLWSRVQFHYTAGVTYRIAIDGYNDGSGPEEGRTVLRITRL